MVNFLFRYCIIFILEVCFSPGIYSYFNVSENNNTDIESTTTSLLFRLFPEYYPKYTLKNSSYCAQFHGTCDACSKEKGCGYCNDKCLVFDYLHPAPKHCRYLINFCLPEIKMPEFKIHFPTYENESKPRYRTHFFWIIIPAGGAKFGLIYWCRRCRKEKQAQRERDLQNQCLEPYVESNSTQINQVGTNNQGTGGGGSTVTFAGGNMPYTKM